MEQAQDFLDESLALAAIVDPLDDAQLRQVTQFKNWTIEDVIGHLYMFTKAAMLTLKDTKAFREFFQPIAADLQKGKSLLDTQHDWLGDTGGRKLVSLWREGFEMAARAYSTADPKARLAWVGPDMSARSCITARQMETWAHGQELFDCLGLERVDTDRIRNIAHLGISTYGWTFVNRKMEVPEPMPHVRLVAPSAAIWEWNDQQEDNMVSGTATEFCQIVTQTRNVADTAIKTVGEAARLWMENAQCFAGPPHPPPAPGSRHRVVER
jgi:uncharacterized protein (TIGR03084 family)